MTRVSRHKATAVKCILAEFASQEEVVRLVKERKLQKKVEDFA
jgi:hypothetical protein